MQLKNFHASPEMRHGARALSTFFYGKVELWQKEENECKTLFSIDTIIEKFKSATLIIGRNIQEICIK